MLMSQVMVMLMVLLVVLSGVGSGVDEAYYPPATGAAWHPPPYLQPRNLPLSCSNCGRAHSDEWESSLMTYYDPLAPSY